MRSPPAGRPSRPPDDREHPGRGRDRAGDRSARRASRGPSRVELRVPRPLHPVGRRVRRSAPRAGSPGTPPAGRGAERPRSGAAVRDRGSPRHRRPDREPRADGPRARDDGARARGRFHRRGAEPPAVGVLRAAGPHRSLPSPRRGAPRARRRLRVRSRVPVRADPPPPLAPARSARPRPLPARRVDRRRPSARGGPAPAL